MVGQRLTIDQSKTGHRFPGASWKDGVPPAKAHLPSLASRRRAGSPQFATPDDEVGGRPPTGGATGDAGQPGQTYSRGRRGQVRLPQSTLADGQAVAEPGEDRATTRTAGLDSQAR